MLSHIVCADVMAPKMVILGDWIFMLAGTLSNADLILEELRLALRDYETLLTRPKIQSAIRAAYAKRFSKWTADRHLFHYDMDMEVFKEKGHTIFGDQRFAELSREIDQDAQNFQEEMLLIGWGETRNAAMIYGINRDGSSSNSLDGIAAIGSGSDAALSTLLSLGCGRNTNIEDALYAVASAKFAAESCGDGGVGRDTFMFIAHKRTEEDPKDKPPGHTIQPSDIDALRKMWERYSKPRIPRDAAMKLHEIAGRYGGGSLTGMVNTIKHSMRRVPRKPKQKV
jgi:ATP-dependent protease HslVU (ClpYQ) peptidase subunit